MYKNINSIYNSKIFKTIYFNYNILLDYCDKLEELEYSFNEETLPKYIQILSENFINQIYQINDEDFFSNSLKLSSIIFMDNELFSNVIENYNLEKLFELIKNLTLLFNYCHNFKYSTTSEIININFFSIFNAALIIYVPHLKNSTKIIELYSTQNVCLIHKKSILLNDKNSLKIIKNNYLGVFDSTYRNIIIKYQTSYDLLELYLNKKIITLKTLLFTHIEIKNSILHPIIFDFHPFCINNTNNFGIYRENIIQKSSFEKSAFLLFNNNNKVSDIFFSILNYISEVCFEKYKTQKFKWKDEEKIFSYFLVLISKVYSYENKTYKSINYDNLFGEIEKLYKDLPIISILLLKILYFQLFNYKTSIFYNDQPNIFIKKRKYFKALFY